MTDQRGLTRLEAVSQCLLDTIAALGGADEPHRLQRIVEVAQDRIPGADAVSTTTLRQGRFTTSAASHDLAQRADELQYRLRSGPSVDDILGGAIYSLTDLENDTRWPLFGRQASSDLGLHEPTGRFRSCGSPDRAAVRHPGRADKAFGLLRMASQNLNLPLREIAADIVHTGTLEVPRTTPRPNRRQT